MKKWIFYIILFLLPLGTVKANILRDDTSTVQVREFNEEHIKELKNNPRYDYTIKESWLRKLWMRIIEYISKFFNIPKGAGGGELYNAIIAIVAIILIIFGLSRIKSRGWITGKGAKVDHEYEITEENIHEIDFDKEIRDAENQNDYRKAIRLYFLKILKNLSDTEHIYWDPNKTNYQYMYELKGSGLFNDFTKAVNIFELVWYGEHPADVNYYNENKHYFHKLANEKIKTKTAVFNG